MFDESEYNDSAKTSENPGPVPSYCMVMDILGFSEIINNLDSSEQDQRIEEWLDLVEATKHEARVKHHQLISDTLFMREEDSAEGLIRLLSCARLLIERGLEKHIPLRGAIVHGDIAFGHMTYGKAVIEAHQIERSLDWIGVACHADLPRLDQLWDWDRIVKYVVPKKTGKLEYMGAVVWEVPEIDELYKLTTGNGLVDENAFVDWEPITKLERTFQFGVYLKVGKALGQNPQRFKFVFPMYFIEGYIKALEERMIFSPNSPKG